MSLEFLKKRQNTQYLFEAKKQQKEISYFTESNIQQDINITYLNQWAERNYVGSDFFLNWVKTVFKTDNFLSFFKYLRYPLVSAKLINDEIKPQLQRVFFAEDYFNKTLVSNKSINLSDLERFKKEIFEAILFNHNGIIIHDLEETNQPFREIINISDVVSIDSEKGQIKRIAYKSVLNDVVGFVYIDEKEYIFYDYNYNVVTQSAHDLGECPCNWISSENFSQSNDVVKKSLFSYVKNDLEELVFLKTLQRMTEPNGAIPVVTKLKTKEVDLTGKAIKLISDKEPMSSASISSQYPEVKPSLKGSDSQLQTGSIISVPAKEKEDGSIDMDVVKNYFQFHYIPVECLDYLDRRINEIHKNIVSSILGDYSEQNESSKNELQVSKSYVNKQDKLRWLASEMTQAIKVSNYYFLSLKHGKNLVSVDFFMGSDFFLETQSDLFLDFKNAPNSIERRNILIRLSQNRNKFSKNEAEREKILYKLIPYASDYDFNTAITVKHIDSIVFEFQTRFNYWIGLFEANYGDLVYFWDSLDSKDSEKLVLINNLIKNLIKDEQTSSNTPPSVQGADTDL